MVRSTSASTVRPLRSNRPRISPTSPRRTASGLMSTSVRSVTTVPLWCPPEPIQPCAAGAPAPSAPGAPATLSHRRPLVAWRTGPLVWPPAIRLAWRITLGQGTNGSSGRSPPHGRSRVATTGRPGKVTAGRWVATGVLVVLGAFVLSASVGAGSWVLTALGVALIGGGVVLYLVSRFNPGGFTLPPPPSGVRTEPVGAQPVADAAPVGATQVPATAPVPETPAG